MEQFHRGKVHHYFVALSSRKPSKQTGTVRGDLSKGRKGVFKLNNNSKRKSGGGGGCTSAVTRYFTRSVAGADGRGLHMLVMKPVTPKRKHQLRATCKHLGAPVLGDATYGGAKAGGEDRAYLHAAAIRIRLPSLPSTLFRETISDEEVEEGEAVGDAAASACADSDSCTDACTAGRVIQIVCAPSEGQQWCTVDFEEAWRSAGFGAAEAGSRVWFPEHKRLLASSLDDLLADGVGESSAGDDGEQDMEEVLHVVDGGAIDVSWEVRKSTPRH